MGPGRLGELRDEWAKLYPSDYQPTLMSAYPRRTGKNYEQRRTATVETLITLKTICTQANVIRRNATGEPPCHKLGAHSTSRLTHKKKAKAAKHIRSAQNTKGTPPNGSPRWPRGASTQTQHNTQTRSPQPTTKPHLYKRAPNNTQHARLHKRGDTTQQQEQSESQTTRPTTNTKTDAKRRRPTIQNPNTKTKQTTNKGKVPNTSLRRESHQQRTTGARNDRYKRNTGKGS